MFNPYLNLILENAYGQKYTLLEIVEQLREYVANISFDDIEAEIEALEDTLDGINDDLDDLSQRITDLDIANLKERMRTAELDIATLYGALQEVDVDLDNILKDETERTIPEKVDEILDIRGGLMVAMNGKGANIEASDAFRTFIDKVANILTFKDLVRFEGTETGGALSCNKIVIDVDIPDFDREGNAITAFEPASGDNNNPFRIASLTGHRYLEKLGQYAFGTSNYFKRVNCPNVINVNSSAFINTEYLEYMCLGCTSLPETSFTSNFGQSAGDRACVLEFPAIANVQISSAYKFGYTGKCVYKFPNLQTIKRSWETTTDPVGHFNTVFDENDDFHALKEVTSRPFGLMDGSKLYLPALEKIDIRKDSMGFTQWQLSPWVVAEGEHADVYIGGNLTQAGGNANQITDVAGYVTAGKVTLHIPEGSSTTKATLDGAGIAYVQDYDPEM